MRAGFQSLPSATVAHFLRRVPPVNSSPNAERANFAPNRPDEGRDGVSGSRLASGAPFAGYTILRPLGAGGMAEVYLALHPRLPRRDVIKVLAEAITADREFRDRFNREADLAATLWHPHIVGVHDRGEYNGQLWISMDYVEGTDASRLVKERYPDGMPVDEVCDIVRAVAGALDYAHDRGLLHRDVKPANILLTHPDDRGAPNPVGGLRCSPPPRRHQRDHRDECRGGNGRLCRARTVDRLQHRWAGGPICVGRHGVSSAHRCAAVPAREPDRGDQSAPAPGPASAQRLPPGFGLPRRRVLHGAGQKPRGQVRAVPCFRRRS